MKRITKIIFVTFTFLIFTIKPNAATICNYNYDIVNKNNVTHNIKISIDRVENADGNPSFYITYSDDCSKNSTYCGASTKKDMKNVEDFEKHHIYLNNDSLEKLKNNKCPENAYVDLENYQSMDGSGFNEVCIGTKAYCESQEGTGQKFINKENYNTGEQTINTDNQTKTICSWSYNTKNDKGITHNILISVEKTETDGNPLFTISYTDGCKKNSSSGCGTKRVSGTTLEEFENNNIHMNASSFNMFLKDKCPAEGYVDLTAFDSGGISEVCIGTQEFCKNMENIGTSFLTPKNGEEVNTGSKSSTGEKGTIPGSEDIEIPYGECEGLEGEALASCQNAAENCEGFLGKTTTKGTPAYYLDKIMKIIKYVAIILVLVLSTMDFVKATTSQDKDLLQKAAKTSVKRLIFAIIIFFLPTLISVVLNFLGDAYSTCIY